MGAKLRFIEGVREASVTVALVWIKESIKLSGVKGHSKITYYLLRLH